MNLKTVLVAAVLIVALLTVTVPVGAYIVTQEDVEGAPGAEFFDQPGFVWQISADQAAALPTDICLNIGDGKGMIPYIKTQGKEAQSELRMKQFYYNFFTKTKTGPVFRTFYYVPEIKVPAVNAAV